MKLNNLLLLLLLPVCLWAGRGEERFFYLGDRDVRIINENWKDYESAATRTGVPVLALVAIHHREAGFLKGHWSTKKKKLVKNIGGPFMLDFGPRNNNAEFGKRVRAYERKIHEIYKLGGKVPRMSHDFSFAALCAAHHLKEKARGDLSRSTILADALWGYNGRATWNGGFKNSAYVWSDPLRGKIYKFKYRRDSGQLVEFEDQRPGVMVIYRELQGLLKKGVIGRR